MPGHAPDQHGADLSSYVQAKSLRAVAVCCSRSDVHSCTALHGTDPVLKFGWLRTSPAVNSRLDCTPPLQPTCLHLLAARICQADVCRARQALPGRAHLSRGLHLISACNEAVEC